MACLQLASWAGVVRAIKVLQKRGDPDPEISEWIELLESSTKASEQMSYNMQTTERQQWMDTRPMVMLLRESLLSHRWNEVASVLQFAMRHRNDCRHTFMKVSQELVLNLHEDQSSIMEQILEVLGQIRKISQKEVFLELILYLLHLGKGKEVSSLSMSKKKTAAIVSTQAMQHSNYMDTLCHGYIGVAKYTEFEEGMQKLKSMESHDEFLSQEDVSDNTTMRQLTLPKAQQAANTLSKVLADIGPGSWDIFVMKLVDIYGWMGEAEKALAVLDAYEASNPDNANVHRYKFEHHSKHNNQEEALLSLKKFCDAIPSDELGLVLYKKLLATGAPHAETLLILFDLLDYGCWQSVLEPWNLLANQLTSREKQVDRKCVTNCWSVRQSWWPSFHFTPHKLSMDENVEGLIEAKIRVASVLIGDDCSYVQKAKKRIRHYSVMDE